MAKERKGIKQRWLVGLIAVCLGIIVCGAFYYVGYLSDRLKEQSGQNVMAVTRQQQQALDTFISKDQ